MADEILLLSFNGQYFKSLYAAFLFWPSILHSHTEMIYIHYSNLVHTHSKILHTIQYDFI